MCYNVLFQHESVLIVPVKGPYVSECSVVLTQLSLLHTHTPTSVGTLPERCVLTSLNMQLDIRD